QCTCNDRGSHCKDSPVPNAGSPDKNSGLFEVAGPGCNTPGRRPFELAADLCTDQVWLFWLGDGTLEAPGPTNESRAYRKGSEQNGEWRPVLYEPPRFERYQEQHCRNNQKEQRLDIPPAPAEIKCQEPRKKNRKGYGAPRQYVPRFVRV